MTVLLNATARRREPKFRRKGFPACSQGIFSFIAAGYKGDSRLGRLALLWGRVMRHHDRTLSAYCCSGWVATELSKEWQALVEVKMSPAPFNREDPAVCGSARPVTEDKLAPDCPRRGANKMSFVGFNSSRPALGSFCLCFLHVLLVFFSNSTFRLFVYLSPP